MAIGIVGAAPAAADQIWIQHVQRDSKDAPCPESSSADTAAGWSAWSPSYAQWPNGGAGGWVCERSITWAKEASATGSGPSSCLLGDGQYDPDYYALFLGNYAADESDSGYPYAYYAGCSDIVGWPDNPSSFLHMVLAADKDEAVARCGVYGDFDGLVTQNLYTPSIWFCAYPVYS